MKRSFLERKGLTEPEIMQAFVRVPEEAATSTPVQPVSATPMPSSQGTGLVTYMPPPPQQQQQQGSLQPPPPPPQQQQQVVPYPAPKPPAVITPEPVRWTQVHAVLIMC